MNDINIFCLYGNYGVGKTYLADKIVERYSESQNETRFVRLSFAKKVKENFVKEIEPSLTLEDLNNREIKEKYRLKIINYAENIKKIEGEDVWAKLVIEEIEEIHETKNINNFIIDDLRFVVEYETLFENFRNDLHLIHLINFHTMRDTHTSLLIEHIKALNIHHYTIYNEFTDNIIEVLENLIKQTLEENQRVKQLSDLLGQMLHKL